VRWHKLLIAAVANAIFDATGVQLRRVPFRDARVLAALKAAGVYGGNLGICHSSIICHMSFVEGGFVPFLK
jgi:hypothetical protein